MQSEIPPALYFSFYILFIYSWETENRDTQAEGKAGSKQGAREGTGFQVSRITPWAKGGAKTLSDRAASSHSLDTSSGSGT